MKRVAQVLKKLGIEVISQRGERLTARCPLHADPSRHKNGDRNPSWSIQEKTGVHFCFSCKYSGNLLQLISDRLEISEFEAQLFLSTIEEQGFHGGLDPLRVVIKSHRKKKFELPSEVVFLPFEQWHKLPARYVQERSIEPWQVDRWGLGYALEGKLLGRIVLPVRDQRGQVVNYAARTFVDDEKRYLAADSRSHFDPTVLFGESKWSELGDLGSSFVVVTEGILNALAIERACSGIAVAALCGSHIHARHISKLSKFGKVIVATDPDPAGEQAADQLMFALSRYRRVSQLQLDCDACDYSAKYGLGALSSAVIKCL